MFHRFLTPAQIAELLQIDVGKVIGWIRTGELPAVNVAKSRHGAKGRWRIAESDFEDFLLRRRTQPPPPKPTRRRILPTVTQYV